MTATLTPTEQKTDGLVLHFAPVMKKLTDDEFYDFCMLNKDLRIELTSEGDLIIMTPTGWNTGVRNSELNGNLWVWAKKDGTGTISDSSTVFTLPNGAKRSPDAAWVRNERLAAFTEEQKEKFLPICPDFVIESRSPSDSVEHLQEKMEEYVANGAQLGWLIDPVERKVHVYRPGAEVEVLDDPETVSGEPLLRGLALDVRALWE